MRRIWLAVSALALVISQVEAQQGRRKAASGASGRKLRDTAAPQSGTPVGASQNSRTGVAALRPPTKPSYQPPSKPSGPPRQLKAGGQPMTPRTRGGANPYAGRDMRGDYAQHAPVGGRRLRSQSARSLKDQINRNLTSFTQNQALNRNFANRGRGNRP